MRSVTEPSSVVSPTRTPSSRSKASTTPWAPESAHETVARARMLELYNLPDEACAEMSQALKRHQGDVFVHMQAAAMFERLGYRGDGRAQRQATDLLSPQAERDPLPPLVDMQGIGGFLSEVNRLLEAVDGGQNAVKR